MFLGQRGADAENLPRATHHVNQVIITRNSFEIQWNPVNTTNIGPNYFGRNNGVVVLTDSGSNYSYMFLMTS